MLQRLVIPCVLLSVLCVLSGSVACRAPLLASATEGIEVTDAVEASQALSSSGRTLTQAKTKGSQKRKPVKKDSRGNGREENGREEKGGENGKGKKRARVGKRSDTVVERKKPSDCFWEAERKSCLVKRQVMETLFSFTDKQAGKPLAKQIECSSAGKDRICKRIAGCKWSKARKECSSTLFSRELNVCFKNDLIALRILDDICTKTHASKTACVGDGRCYWDDFKAACKLDVVKTIAGFSPDDLAVSQFRRARGSALEDAFNTRLFEFVNDPDSILFWSLPRLRCPTNIPDAACTYVKILDKQFVQNKYCSTKYDIVDITSCNSDPLCLIGRQSFCSLSPEARSAIDDEAQQVLFEKVKNQQERDLVALPVTCATRDAARCKNDCEVREGSCTANYKGTALSLLSSSKTLKSKRCSAIRLLYLGNEESGVTTESLTGNGGNCTQATGGVGVDSGAVTYGAHLERAMS